MPIPADVETPPPLPAFASARRERLAGGTHSLVERLRAPDGATLVLKRADAPPPDLYASEAAGLRLLAGCDVPRVPAVLGIGADWLALEDLGSGAETDAGWEDLGRRLAHLHGRVAGRFGLGRDNWFGPLPQANAWDEDGCRFYAERRFLPLLRHPVCLAALTVDDRRGVERLAARLAEIVPPSSPRLLHGDLWRTNVVFGAEGRAGLVDPATYFGWPLVDLGSARLWGGFPERFFAAYAEAARLEAGWREPAAALDVVYLLGMIACGAAACVRDLRDRLARFS